MADLLWPGDHRAGGLFTDEAVLDAMLAVETAWSAALVATGVAPAAARIGDRRGLVGPGDLETVAVAAEGGGTPVLPLVALLRERLSGDAARWLHRGLTSQDVVDTAIVLNARAATGVVRGSLADQARLLTALADRHRGTRMTARTLTQPAVPTTFGLRAAQWLTGILDAADDLAAITLPAQFGGAAGTQAALVELAGDRAAAVVSRAASELGLAPAPPWHTVRSGVTRLGDAAVRCTDAWGHVAGDVLTLGRPEIGELSEGAGGGSSTMPHKSNPVLSVLIRRGALAALPLAATLHVAAAETTDERSAGPWQVEWATLRTLLRRAVVAGSQTTDLLTGLVVHEARMAAALDAAPGLDSEQRTMAQLAGRPPAANYLGLSDTFVDAACGRAVAFLEGTA